MTPEGYVILLILVIIIGLIRLYPAPKDVPYKRTLHSITSSVLRYSPDKSEKDYQDEMFKNLFSLVDKYRYSIQTEQRVGKYRVDIAVNHNIGIELKLYKGDLYRIEKEVLNQCTIYGKRYKYLIFVIVNPTPSESYNIRNTILYRLAEQNITRQYEVLVVTPR